MIEFATFFTAVHACDDVDGPPPYPWQAALAHRLATASPPRAIVVPTGGGKTGTIDALVWALAMQAERSPLLRTIGVRTVWAIDRRILVDEVHAHAEALAALLAEAARDVDHILHGVALALASLTGGGPPLVATRWRGGIAIGTPSHHPFQPEIISSTVAQVGSRLLFRGYGVGRRSLAVQAALAAVDTTICVDEAHLAEPFRQTVEAIVGVRGREPVALPPLHLITLTATPSAALAGDDTVTIGDEDRTLLGDRLTGEKLARLVEPVSPKAADRRIALLDAIDHHLADGAGSVACVVNSVRTAVDVHRALATRFPGVTTMILIGPQRPADRAQLMAEHRSVLFDRARGGKPLVVVATQTFEVGLDADVEALVTESASASAIIQRLGRLNRAGMRHGRATIVRADDESGLYAGEEPAAWAWLTALAREDGTIDVSVQALADDGTRPDPVAGPTPPALTGDVLDRLVQTAPRPAKMDDPDVDAFLRGAEAEPSADVMVAWRCDLRADDDGEDARAYRRALLQLAPPQPDELVTLSIARARALLVGLREDGAARAKAGGKVLDGPDLEGGELVVPAVRDAVDRSLVHVLLRGDDHLESGPKGWEPPRPGDVIVLPSSLGGYQNGAVDPTSRTSVVDVGADLVAARHYAEARKASHADVDSPTARRGSGIVPDPAGLRFWRLSVDALSGDSLSEDAPGRVEVIGRHAARSLVRKANAAARPDGPGLTPLVDHLVRVLGGDAVALGLGESIQLDLCRVTPDLDLFAGDVLGLGDDDDAGDDADQALDDDAAMFDDERTSGDAFVLVVRRRTDREILRTVAPPTLDEHVWAVTARTVDSVQRAELPAVIAATLTFAARAHDHGKADPRNQAYFRGGAVALGDEVIAKSVFGTDDRRADRAARKAAGLPSDLRHEVESVTVLMRVLAAGQVADLPPELDRELLLHIVGTHHGFGLPVPRLPHGGRSPHPYEANAAGITGTGDGDGKAAWANGAWLERFLALSDHYGPWGLAYLRTLLVLADRIASSKDEREPAPDLVAAGVVVGAEGGA